MLLRNQEKEIAELDYQLQKKKVDEEIEGVLCGLEALVPDGAWLQTFEIGEVCYERVCFCEKGIFVFLKENKELTDLTLWKALKASYDVFVECMNHADEKERDLSKTISFYVLLNGPITQKAYYALFNPKIEFLASITDLASSFRSDLELKGKVYEEEELISLLSCFDESEEEEDEDLYSDETGDYIRVRGDWKRRSMIDPERYYLLALFGGFLGIHKCYAKCYGSFVVYLLTLGYCGIGWIFDLAEIVLGIAKDRKKAYIGPFEEKKQKLTGFLAALVVYLIVVVLVFVVQ